jgi:hypothetical protein
VISEDKMSQDKKVVAEMKLREEEITKEILEGLSKDTNDSDSYDAESGGEDSEDRPWRPSHAVFGKSTIK